MRRMLMCALAILMVGIGCPARAAETQDKGVDRGVPGRKYALLIGVASYQGFHPLPFCRNDVRRMAKALAGAHYGKVVALVDEPGKQAPDQPTSRSSILSAM